MHVNWSRTGWGGVEWWDGMGGWINGGEGGGGGRGGRRRRGAKLVAGQDMKCIIYVIIINSNS